MFPFLVLQQVQTSFEINNYQTKKNKALPHHRTPNRSKQSRLVDIRIKHTGLRPDYLTRRFGPLAFLGCWHVGNEAGRFGAGEGCLAFFFRAEFSLFWFQVTNVPSLTSFFALSLSRGRATASDSFAHCSSLLAPTFLFTSCIHFIYRRFHISSNSTLYVLLEFEASRKSNTVTNDKAKPEPHPVGMKETVMKM